MKNIFKIYKKDLKDIFTNKVLLIIISGLTMLPALYAWPNIKASWDPYGNTKNISVAIVNKDKGTNLRGTDVNIGDEVVNNLKENKDLGWKFVDEKTALDGVKKGKYYAAIKIPEDFSKDLTSVVSDNIKKGELVYTVNEKINAIAPKITDKGASAIQAQVSQEVVKTVTEVMFDVFNEVGIELENQLPKLITLENDLIEIQGKFKDIEKAVSLASDANHKINNLLSDLQKDIPSIQNTIANSKKLASDVKTFLQDSKGSLDEITPIIKNDLQIIADVSSSASSSVSDLIDAVNNASEDNAQLINDLIDNLDHKLSSLSNIAETVLEFLKKLDKFDHNNRLEEPIEKLQSIVDKLNTAMNTLDNVKSQIANGKEASLDDLNKILQITKDVNNISSEMVNNFDSKISDPINNIFTESFKAADDAITVLDNAQKKLPAVEDSLDSALDLSNNAEDGIKLMKEKLPLAKSKIDKLVTDMEKLNNKKEMNDLISLLKNDAIKHSDFLKNPVNLVTNKLYPMEKYGYAMTPFYTVLSIWVGILLLMSLLSTKVHGNYKPYEIYFGRGLTFMSIAIVQALIVSIGDMLLLGVKVINPILFVMISVFTSCVFTAIVYSLVSMFNNVGKAMGIVLLVIQVAGSGGTFPIQVTPKFFQMVNPFLPFTYAISALRETVAGIYQPNLTKDISVLAIFMVVSIAFTLGLKGPINRATAGVSSKLNESDLVGH